MWLASECIVIMIGSMQTLNKHRRNLSSKPENTVVFHPEEGTLSLGLQSGLLIAVPICEEHAAVGQQIDDAIQTAVAEARYGGHYSSMQFYLILIVSLLSGLVSDLH